MGLPNNVNVWVPRTLETGENTSQNILQVQNMQTAHAGVTNLNNNDLSLYLQNLQYYIGSLQTQVASQASQISDLQSKK